ncbi:hypothetical protein GCM10016455_05780 [Aliiroseovarius zhejiangensis]|uniref:Uncharacterized protein n=1 Tax=Aliiroseovarius zhejiangensis TaxID=1632025 RepID=A0ABQ3IMY6_9RHOB|nr:hypothetical protein [Aliiroseovarius zhejiangensis]GHE88493.1 hypothetical protein GCM10016455_05780 [Aliiroseovarius zhejiangensis]
MTLDIHQSLVEEIDDFLSDTGMSDSYFGKVATGNSEVVSRLKAGRTITGRTEKNLRDFMAARRAKGAA